MEWLGEEEIGSYEGDRVLDIWWLHIDSKLF